MKGIANVLSKVAKGEVLTDDERKTLEGFNFDKHSEGIRKDALKEVASLKSKLDELESKAAGSAELEKKLSDMEALLKGAEDEKLSETEKLTKSIQDLTEKVALSETKQAEAEKAAAETRRTASIDSLRSTNGINFAKGIAANLTERAWRDQFEGVNLDDAEAVKASIESFKEANSGIILAPSDGGSGSVPGEGAPAPSDDFMKMSEAEQTAAVLAEAEGV